MRYDNAVRRVEMSPRPVNQSFSIATNAKMFEILYSSLYKRPLEAIMRELTSNIFDAHLLNGTTERGKIVLPGPLTPFLIFRDYGPGLCDYDVRNLYTTLGASTKEDDEEAIGAYGLGSKTPLAYTDAFSVISRHGGRQRVYTVVKGADKIPILQSDDIEVDADEPDGLEIRIPTRAIDEFEWDRVAHRVLRWFPFDKIELVGSNTPLTKPTFVHETEDWAILEGEGPSVALSGPVTYELDWTVLEDGPQKRVVFKIPMGEVVPQPSREGLTYDPKTLRRMNEAIVQFNVEFAEWIEQGLEGLGPWDRAVAIRRRKAQWEGFPFPFSPGTLTLTQPALFINVREGRRRRKYGGRSMSFSPEPVAPGHVVQPSDSTVVILNDIEDPRQQKIRKRLKNNEYLFGGKRAVYIVNDLVDIGSPSSVMTLSELDDGGPDKVKKGPHIKRERPMVFTITPTDYIYEKAARETTEEPGFGTIYADLQLRTVLNDNWKVKTRLVRATGRGVMGLSKTAKRYYRDVEMESLDKAFNRILRELKSDKDLISAWVQRQALIGFSSSLVDVLTRAHAEGLKLPADCLRIVTQLQKPSDHPRMRALDYAISSGLMEEPRPPRGTFDFRRARDQLATKYPVFALLMTEIRYASAEQLPILIKSLKVRE